MNSIQIKNGQIIEGRLNKDVLAPKEKNNLIQLVWDNYGVEGTNKFINDTQRLINNFNLYNGFSLGFGDTTISKDIESQIELLFNTKELKIEHMITEIENNPNLMEPAIFERNIMGELSIIRDETCNLIMNNLSPTNGLFITIKSGSKGNKTNIGQISGCVGLQIFESNLVPKKYNKRTQPYFHQNDDRGASRGLIRNPFKNGLEYPEFVFHLLTSRSDIIGTAIKTADTGYIQRKMVKSMEDIMIKHDGTVRSANDLLLQVVYGDSGADTTRQFEYKIELISMGNKDIETMYKFTQEELAKIKDFSSKDNDNYIKYLISERDKTRANTCTTRSEYLTLKTEFMLPVNITRILDNVINSEKKSKSEPLTPKYILAKINELLLNSETTLMCMKKSEQSNPNSIKYKDDLAHKSLFRFVLNSALAPKRIMYEYALDKNQFDTLVVLIKNAFNKNIIEAGEMVGIIVAQSMGEPLTQMTLSSFHKTGLSMGLGGIPKVKELLNVSKNPKNPNMHIYLELDKNIDLAHKIAAQLKYTIFGDIRDKLDVYYDPYPDEPDSIMQNDNVKNVFYSHDGVKSSSKNDYNNLPWLFRIEINREKMMEKEVTITDIKSKFSHWWEKRTFDAKNIKKEEKKVMSNITKIAILSNSDNDLVPIIHIRFNVKDTDKEKFKLDTINNFIEHIIDTFELKGLKSVNDILLIDEKEHITFNPESGNIEKKKAFIIHTEGINMLDIRYISGINILKTISNDIVETYNTFGVEIARTLLLNELCSAFDMAGKVVNYQHFSVIADLMTMSGSISSIDRHSMNKYDNEPLCRASFEKSVDQLLTASVFGEVDNMKGISARIMTGSVIKGGTGYCNTIINYDMIENAQINDDNSYVKKFSDIINPSLANDISKQVHDDIFIPL